MPRLRRRQRITKEHSLRTKLFLLDGHAWDSFGDGPALDHDELRAAWDELRDELMARHLGPDEGGEVNFQGKPFTRPWAWWEFDAPEPRRRIKPGRPYSHYRRPASLGIPANCLPEEFETELSYLERLNLLTDEEREASAAKRGQPEC